MGRLIICIAVALATAVNAEAQAIELDPPLEPLDRIVESIIPLTERQSRILQIAEESKCESIRRRAELHAKVICQSAGADLPVDRFEYRFVKGYLLIAPSTCNMRGGCWPSPSQVGASTLCELATGAVADAYCE